MYQLTSILSLFVLFAFGHNMNFISPPCVVKSLLDGQFKEEFDFTGQGTPAGPKWEGVIVTANTNKGLPSLLNWTYEVTFCHQVTAYLGTDVPAKSLGFDFGRLKSFVYLDHPVTPIQPVPQPATPINPQPVGPQPATPLHPQPSHNLVKPVKQFVQEYDGGDMGPPCKNNMERSSVVNIWCGPLLDCTSVTGSTGGKCLSATTSPFCICSVRSYNGSGCAGLEINILSTNCPTPANIPDEPVGNNTAGVVFGVIFLILAIMFICAYVYNWKVQGRRGLEAIPFTDKCCPGSSSSYNSPSFNSPQAPSYSGGTSTGYQSV